MEGTAGELPVKGGAREPRRIEAALAVVTRGGKVLARRRSAAERRLAGFWELPAPDEIPGLLAERVLGAFRHTITHHRYTITVVAGRASAAPQGMRWLTAEELASLPLTTASRKALALA
jgi:adenine-specific DNA glycosylase